MVAYFFPKRYRASQALTLELMENSFNVVNSLENIEKRLLEKYGENASLLHWCFCIQKMPNLHKNSCKSNKNEVKYRIF